MTIHLSTETERHTDSDTDTDTHGQPGAYRFDGCGMHCESGLKVVLHGKGAGRSPTAGAVLADIRDLVAAGEV